MPNPLVTVVVVNYNGAHLLPACLDGVRALDVPTGYAEVVVVDNASSDGSRTLLREHYPWVQTVESHENLGFAGGNNLALRQVRTPFVALLNNDAIPEPDWLTNLLAPFDAAGADRLGVVTGKVVFRPRFARVHWTTPGFDPGPHDPRELGARVHRVLVDGRDVTDKVLWERLAFGPEGEGEHRFRWARPVGDLLIPVQDEPGDLASTASVVLRVSAETAKVLDLTADGARASATITTDPSDVVLRLDPGHRLADVINNVGGIVLRNGYGADRGFQEVDEGQYAEPRDVFAGCGNGIAVRTAAGAEVGWFDDDFFMYYEDTDLSWRLRSRGWRIRYEPSAVLRHVHAASSKEWSPRWVFHVDRNRLLMLVKNASPRFALREVLRYPLSAGSMAVRAVRDGLRHRSRPALRPHLLRVQVIGSFLRLLPSMLARRRAGARAAVVSRSELEHWLVESR